MQFKDYLAQLTALYVQAEVNLQLQAPASPEEIAALESSYGYRLPVELKNAWLHGNGGATDQHLFARPGYLTGFDFLSIDDALKERAGMLRRSPQYANYRYEQGSPRDARISPGWYEPGWLPFAKYGGATLLLILDFSPTTQGQAGQIITFTHDPDCIDYVAPSFDVFLRDSLNMLREYSDEFILDE